MSFVIVRIFGEVGSSLTKNEIEPVKRFDFFTTSSRAYKEIKNHPKTTAADGAIVPTISAGGCRFIQGPVGDLQCGCHDPGQCLKGHNSAVLVLTPKCWMYHVRAVPV